MPELTWVEKNKVITHHLDVPYRVRDRRYMVFQDGVTPLVGALPVAVPLGPRANLGRQSQPVS